MNELNNLQTLMILLVVCIGFILIKIFYKQDSTWFTLYRCVSCKRYLTRSEKMYSHGRCPKCGYKGKSAVTIVDTDEKACRYVYKKPWYVFWEEPKIEIKD